MPREVCMLSAQAGRNTPCWWDCGTFCKRRVAFRRGGGGTVPSDLAGLAAWFRGGVGVTVANGLVSQWDDQSGNGRHLKQTTDTNKPTLQSDGSLLFDGSDNYMKCDAFTLNQPETVYFLGRQVTWANSDGIFDGNTTNSMRLVQTSGGASPQVSINAGSQVAANTDLPVNTYAVVACVFNGATSLLQVNEFTPTTGNAGAGNAGGFALGARGAVDAQFGNIQVKEIAIFSVAHNAETRAQVVRYLRQVGGI